jgi:hypothetical protein
MHDLESYAFDGETFDPERDGARLTSEFLRVFKLMRDGQWRTLKEISRVTGDSEAGISARLRDFRKAKFGSYQVERRYVTAGVWQYRVLRPTPSGQARLW